ncbi:MAG TPA: copper chaperone [Nannocystis exedens]|nr:copper chaperone [Nannocystis exedens]
MRGAFVLVALCVLCACGAEPSGERSGASVEGPETAQKSQKSQVPAGARGLTLTIEGMSCQGCADAAAQALASVDGVYSSECSFATKTANVQFDPKRTNVDTLVAAIEKTDRGAAPVFRVTDRVLSE